jgi:hypothetical protein
MELLSSSTRPAFYEPDFQLFADRFRTFLPRRHSIFWALVTDVLVSLIKRSNLGKSRVGNQGRFARFGDREVFAPCGGPAVCAQHIVCWSLEHPVGTCIAIHLQGAREAFQETLGVLVGAFRRVDKGHPPQIFTAPGSVITGDHRRHCGCRRHGGGTLTLNAVAISMAVVPLANMFLADAI